MHSPSEKRWFLLTATPLDHENGGAVISHQDITARHLAEIENQFRVLLNDAIHRLTDAGEITATYARMLAEHLRADRCAYAEVEADEDHFVITVDYTTGSVSSIVGRYAMSQFGTEALRLMHVGEAYVVHDVDADARILKADLASYRQTEIQSVVCVPLFKHGRFAAVMAVHMSTPRVWPDNELSL